jgi:hypothetical protein
MQENAVYEQFRAWLKTAPRSWKDRRRFQLPGHDQLGNLPGVRTVRQEMPHGRGCPRGI